MPPTSPSQTAIFWDFENCRPSSNISGNKVVYNIRRLVQGYGSITTFRAYIDLSVDCAYSRSINFHSDLQSSGLSLLHCPHNGKKDVADKMMIVDMLAFAIDRPAPACIVIITGDRDFAYAAAILKLRGYRIIVISPASSAHTSLKVQADNLYDWQTDVLDPMDFVVDSGSQRSETLVASAPKPSGPPVSAASTSPVCLIHDYPDTTSRIGPLRNEVLSITRPRSESNSFLSSLRDPHRPTSSFNSHVDSSPSLSNQCVGEAGMDFGLHGAGSSTCHGDAMILDELSCSENTRATLGRAAKSSVAFEPARESHPSFRRSSRLLESSEASTEFETASLISEMEPDAPISEPSLIAKPTSTREATSSGNTLHGYIISSVPDLTHIRLETLQDTSAGYMERRQVEQGGIKADSTRGSYQLSNRALYKLSMDASHSSQLSLAIVSGSEKCTFVLSKGPSGKVKLAPKAKPDAPKELNKAKKEKKKATKARKAAPKKSVANKKTLATSTKQIKKVSVAKAPGGKGTAPNKPVEKAQSETLSKKPNPRPAKKPTVPSKKATSAKTKPAAKKSSSKKSGVKKAAAKAAASKPKKPVSKGKLASKTAASSKKPTSTKSTKPAADQPCIRFESAVKAGQTSYSSNSSVPTAASIKSAPLPTREDQQRFQTLISFFIERRVANRPTRIISSEVAVEIQKRNPGVFKIAGVTKLKPYIEAARKVRVIISSGLDSKGSGWVEINPVLYSPAQEDTQSTKSAAYPATPSKQSSSSQASQPAAEWVYAPLTSRLRAEIPSHRLLYSTLGTFFRAQHPDLYKRASVSGLSAYLKKAERNGIIRIGGGGSSGSEWAELMPAYRAIVHHESNS